MTASSLCPTTRRSACPYAAYAELDDPVIDVSVTPNRQDAMGVRGIARDLAAAGLGTLKPLDVPQIAGDFPCPVYVRIEDEDGCPAFYGRVMRGVRNGPSPEWLQRRLKAVGQRPISALVDITNYVSIGLGRPLHVYDLAKIEGGITARRARDGETVEALNGKTYTLDPSMTAMADDKGADGIGGIMGGEPSSVTEGDDRHPDRMRLVHAGADRADRAEARPHLRRAAALRARRRSRFPGGRHPDRDRAGR